MKNNNTNDSVIIINKINNTASNIIEKEHTQIKNTNKKELININIQIKIFAILMMLFAVMLMIALITHTAKDEPNLQIKFTELFGLFSNDPIIKMKFDTTINAVGLLGAIISNLLINEFIGIWIIGMPIVLFIWGIRLIKKGDIENNIVTASYTYIIIATIIACLFGALSCFESMTDMPLYLYGSIGAFIGTIISNIISPIGSTTIFTLVLIITIYKLIKINPKNIIIKIKSIDKIKIQIILLFKKITNYIYRFLTEKNKDKIDINSQIFNKKNDIIQQNNSNITNTNYEIENKENIFNNTQENILDIKDILSPNIITNDIQINKFKNKIKKNAFDTPIISVDYAEIDSVSTANNNTPTIIDDAVFTFNPPVNLTLPKQTIIPKNYAKKDNFLPIDRENGTDDSLNIVNENRTIVDDSSIIIDENINTEKNKIIADEELIETLPNSPIKIELNKPKLVIEIEDKPQPQVVSNYKSFKNPLSVGIMDEKINYIPPKFDLLDQATNEYFAADEELQRNGRILQEKLETFRINISNLEVTRGPVVTQYEFIPADGVKINKIEGLSDDLAMALKAKSVHIIAPVPEKGTVGIQIPNSNPSIVKFRSVIASKSFVNSSFELPLALGKTVSGEPYIADLTKMPHLLIAGSTGSGKSVGVNTIISSLLYKKHPSQLKFVVIDPKKVELTPYSRLSNHFLAISPDLNTEIVTEPSDAIIILKAAVLEMEKRYTLLEIAKQRNIKDYNEKVRTGALKNDIIIDHRELPYLVVIVDELADLMLTAGKEIELPIVRLAQMARAVGIHLIIATQRPSVNIITGIIKANFPSRIAYLVASKVDSRTILDASGAEALLGNGDMLFSAANQVKAIRIQNPFISTDEVERLCDFIGNQVGYSEPYILPSTYEKGNDSGSSLSDVSNFDPLFREAAELIITQQLASTSMLQRRLKIGFARAGRIIDELASAKVIGPPQGSKPRNVLMESMSELERVFK